MSELMVRGRQRRGVRIAHPHRSNIVGKGGTSRRVDQPWGTSRRMSNSTAEAPHVHVNSAALHGTNAETTVY